MIQFTDLAKLIGVAPFDYTICTDGGGHDWQMWVRSFEWYLQANKIEDDHEKFVKLMHLAGSKVQELFATLPVPVSVNKVNRGPLRGGCVPHLNEYEMAIAKLNDHFQPKKNLTYERHTFRQIKQEDDEKLAFFAMRLRKQADRCDFGEKFEEQIKDQIIEKCASKKLRLKLLSLGDADLDKIMNEAKVFEAVQEQSEALNDKHGDTFKSAEINKIDVRPKPNQNSFNKDECHRCGYTGHRQFDDKCPARGKTCNKCGGRNHFSRKCRSKKRARNPAGNWQSLNLGNSATDEVKRGNDEPSEKKAKIEDNDTIKMVDAYQSNVKDDYVFCIESSPEKQTSQVTKEGEHVSCIGDNVGNEIKCKIGGVEITVTIDSGTKKNIIDSKAWDFLKANHVVVFDQIKGSTQEFRSYGGYPLTMIGMFKATVKTAYNERPADFYVVENYGKVLIGYETGIPLGVMKIGENVNEIGEIEQMSKIKGFVIDIPIDKNVKPVAQPYRRMPVPMEEKVDKKIDELMAQGIIEKVKTEKNIIETNRN